MIEELQFCFNIVLVVTAVTSKGDVKSSYQKTEMSDQLCDM